MIDWLVGTLIATSALMALVLAIREPLRRCFGPSVAYALWLIPAARMILPSFSRTIERVTSAAAIPALPPAAGFSAGPAEVVATGAIFEVGNGTAVLIAGWIAGAVIVLAIGLSTYFAQRRAILGDGVQLARIDGIRLIRSEHVRGPLAFGIVDRVVIVPLDFECRFSERQRSLALDHELAHHRSGDLVANLIAFLLLCLQWFNPLAWAAHAAFRFDQEAACDARVLDKAEAGDRPTYGEAIAKAASARTLLFAGALDRPSTLSRRLMIMTRETHSKARKRGYFLIGGGVLLGVPLTATYAVQYVDVAPAAAPAPVAPGVAALLAPVAPVAAAASVAPVAAAAALVPATAIAPLLPVAAAAAAAAAAPAIAPPAPDVSFIGNDSISINGRTKRWEELSPAERRDIRARTDDARRDLNRQLAKLPEEMAQARREAERFRNGEFQREMAAARIDMQRAMADLDRQSAVLRASGQNPERMKAEIRRSLADVEQMDIDKIVRESLAAVDPGKIRAQVMSAVKSLDDIDVRLNQLDRR